jgi:hypothetical protein
MNKRNGNYTVGLRGDTFHKLEKHKEKSGIPMTVIIKFAVDEYLDHKDKAHAKGLVINDPV